MMDSFIEFAKQNAHSAHWYLFFAALLAGMNIPISIDLLMILGATLAATLIPENLYLLYFSLLIGCIFSAWIAYFLGRLIGPKLFSLPLLNKLMSKKRLAKIRKFYAKRGILAIGIGRFIPFGVRNGLYMTSGMSRMPFIKFALVDALACMLWSGCSFFLYYHLGKNIETLYPLVKKANFLIFLVFSVTVIGIIWYKKRKKVLEKDV